MCLSLDKIERKRLEKYLKKNRDARLRERLLALLALADGQLVEQVATFLRVSDRSIRNWLQIYRAGGVKALLTLHHHGDAG